MRKIIYFLLLMLFELKLTAQSPKTPDIRKWTDTCHFVKHSWEIDSFIRHIETSQLSKYKNAKAISSGTGRNMWGVVICPHDSYKEVGYLYPALLSGVTAKHLLLIGAYETRSQEVPEGKLIFESFQKWDTPLGPIDASDLRTDLLKTLPDSLYVINNTVMQASSVFDALLPLIQYYGKNRDIIPILVPAFSLGKMQITAKQLSNALDSILKSRGWLLGKDFAIIIASNAVGYGTAELSGNPFQPYGTDSSAKQMAINKDYDLNITYLLNSPITPFRVNGLGMALGKKEDYHHFSWPWDGRFPMALGLYTGYFLRKKNNIELRGYQLGYETNFKQAAGNPGPEKTCVPIPDLKKWNGYNAIGFR
ncbi:MAG: AmmeMemoRadiSam system protein B [Bacteroidota bacterium]